MRFRLTTATWRRQGLHGLAASALLAVGACAATEPPRDSPPPSPFFAAAPEPTPAPAAPAAPIVATAPAPLKPAAPAAAPAPKPAQQPAASKPAASKPAASKPAAAKPAAVAPAAAQFRQCRDGALELDRQARSRATAAAYRAAAEQAAKCDQELGGHAATVPLAERLPVAALAILDALKGGDTAVARRHLQRFKARFPGQDLALADGTSFVDTIELLLSGPEGEIRTRHAQRSISPAARRELLRARYWARN